MTLPYDALLVFGFGGPEGPDEVLPFLRRVTRGRNIPDARLEKVAENYHHFGGRSPINAQNEALRAAIESELSARGVDLPVFLAHKFASPTADEIAETLSERGHKRVLVIVTSAFSSYSGCRSYLELLAAASEKSGVQFAKLRAFFNHPGFLDAMAERIKERAPSGPYRLIFTAHSIPRSMAESSSYTAQLSEAARLIAERVGKDAWDLVYQSRSGPPQIPWLEPDIADHLRALGSAKSEETNEALVVPLGFLSDHIEILNDLDRDAKRAAEEASVGFHRAGTVGVHPIFIRGLADLIEERLAIRGGRLAEGRLPALPDECAPGCCPSPRAASSAR